MNGGAEKPLRFCFVTTFYPPYHHGGDGVFVYRLAEALAVRGHTVDVLHSMDAFRLRPSANAPLAFAHHPNVTRFPLETATPRLSTLSAHQLGSPGVYAGTLEAHFARHSYDVIHYHNVSLMGAPGVMRLGDAVKLYTTHEYWLVCQTHVLLKYEREACTSRECVRCSLAHRRPPQLWRATNLLADATSHLDAFIMPSRFAMDRHRQDGITGDMRVIPHFVPMPASDAPLRTAKGPERPYFLFVGRLEKLKGVQDLLTIFRDYREADLVIVGSGEYEPALREMARGLPNVQFTGRVHPSAVSAYYQHATAVLVPSLCYETFALSAAEAVAHGTPIIGRRLGALEELIVQSQAGIAFDTTAECRSAMERLVREPDTRAMLSQRGREFALAHWTIDAHLDQYFALIAERMAMRSGPRA